MILLNDDGIYIGQIKQILKSFNLPRCPIWDSPSTYANGEHYIKGDALYKIDSGNNIMLGTYQFGNRIDGLTNNLDVSSAIYDSKTHNYLGEYLRFLRDFKGIDLMGLYNCCSYESPSNFEGYVNDTSTFDSSDSRYTLMMLPVKWGHKYTIAIDCHGALEMACMHYDANNTINTNNADKATFIEGTYVKKYGTRFNHPFIYDLSSKHHNEDTKEGVLKLFMKIPASCKSSIVVLEGDFTNNSMENLYMDGYMLKLGHEPVTSEGRNNPIQYVCKSELLSLNLGQKGLLADRLMEYLSLNAICPIDEVVDNIKRLQKTLKEEYPNTFDVVHYGVWDDSMRECLYKFAWEKGIIHKYDDILSYFDKDIETKIGGLASKHSSNEKGSTTFTQGTIGGR